MKAESYRVGGLTSWAKVRPNGNAPPARRRHTAVSDGSKVFIFGGTDDKEFHSDLTVLNTSMIVAKSVLLDNYLMDVFDFFSTA